MKISTNLTLFVFLILILPAIAVCQNSAPDEPPYRTMNIKFVLEGTPSPEDVGFNNPKSFWQFRYELRFLKESFPFQSFREKQGESQKEREKRIRKNNKLYDKGWKKNGVLVTKGTISKTQLLSAANREIKIPVNLTPEITNILAKAGNTWENPDFRISLRGKLLTQADSNTKLKRKLTHSFVCPTKIQTKQSQHWVTNTCGISFELRKDDNGKVVVGWISRI